MMTLTEKIRLVNSDKDLSKGAKLLTIEIIIASNFRGYCWHSISAFGEMISASESQIHRYLRELVEQEWVTIKRRPRRTNLYYPGKKFCSDSEVSPVAPKIEIKKKQTVQDGFSSSSPKQPYPLPLVNDIIRVTGDRKSLRYWVTVVKKVPESEIREGLAFLGIAMNEKIIAHPGAYLNALILKNHPELRKTGPVSLSTSTESIVIQPKHPTEDIIPASYEQSMAAIRDILARLNRKVG